MLRQIFRVTRMDHPSIPSDEALALAVWAMNQTAGPAGVSPQALVMGVNPRLPVKPANLPGHRERCQAIAEARAEMVKLVAQTRSSKAFRQRVPKAAGVEFGPGARVLVYRDIPNEWEGPYTVEGSDGKLLWLNIKDQLKLFSVNKVKLYKPPLAPSDNPHVSRATGAATSDDQANAAATPPNGAVAARRAEGQADAV